MLLSRIVLFISLYKIIDARIQARIPARILPTVYLVEVVGVAYCPYDFQGVGVVVLSLNPNDKFDVKPVEKMKVRYGQRFYIAGKVRALGKPPLVYLKIHHNCMPRGYMYEKIFIREIPLQYMMKLGSPHHYFYTGNINLANISRQVSVYKAKIKGSLLNGQQLTA